MAIPAILLLAAACAGNDITKTGPDATDLGPAAYVYPGSATVTVSPAANAIAVGGYVNLSASMVDSKGFNLTPYMGSHTVWTSSDTSIAKVSSTGKVTGIKNGTVTIKAYAEVAGGSATVKVGTGTASGTSTASKPPAGTSGSTSTTGSTSGSTGSTSGSTGSTSGSSTSVPTPPASSQVGSGTGLSGLQMIGDDFSKYGSTSALMANITANGGGTGTGSVLYSGALNAKYAELDQTVTYNGHPTMKYNQPGGVATTPELSVALPTMTKKLWIRTHIRYSAGFTTVGTIANCANAYKVFGWGWAGMDGSGRLEITNTNQYDFYWGMQDRATGKVIGGGDGTHVSPGHITTEWSDGAWYTYIIELDYSTSPAVTRIYMARGTDKPVLKATNSGAVSASNPVLNSINIGMNFNQSRYANGAQALWFGDWEAVDGAKYSDPFGVK